MFSDMITVYLFCFLITNIKALETCPGPSADSQEDLPWKFSTSSIVVYGEVREVNGNTVTLKISCLLKGQLTESTIQLFNVNNNSECHYLTANKDYIVFLGPSKLTTSNNKILYQLMNIEEIEITSDSLAKFLDDECSDEDDYGIPMIIFYADINNKCGKFQVICNEDTRTSILNLNYSPLSKTSIFIGGIKYPLRIPKMDQTEDGMISGKQSLGTGDETLRSTATISTMFIPMVLIITGLTMVFNN